MRLYKICKVIARPLCAFLFPRKVYGRDRLCGEGPLIICANHISYIDPVFLGLELQQPIRFIAKKEAVDAPILGPFICKLGAFPVDREGKDLKAIRTCMSILKKGGTLGIFPEGTRVINGKTSEAKAGIALIAKKSNATILLAHIRPQNGRVRLFRKTEVFFSEPIQYSDLCGDLDYVEASQKILDTIYALGEEE